MSSGRNSVCTALRSSSIGRQVQVPLKDSGWNASVDVAISSGPLFIITWLDYCNIALEGTQNSGDV